MKHTLYLLLAVLLMAGCHGSQNATSPTTGGTSPADVVSLPEAVSARAGVELIGEDLSCSGRLRMLRDDVVQLNLVLLGMNVGTLEFTPDTVLLIDRVNKQYVRAPYTDIAALSERQMGFREIQALFWGDNMAGRTDSQLSWTYSAFGKVNRHKIPSNHQVRFRTASKEAGFNMSLTEISNERQWATRTEIDETKYKKRDANALFKALLAL